MHSPDAKHFACRKFSQFFLHALYCCPVIFEIIFPGGVNLYQGFDINNPTMPGLYQGFAE